MKYFVGAALLALATTAQANAAEFTGFRAEARTGWDHVSAAGVKEDGLAFGLGVGYDIAAGGFILGVEAGVDFSTVDVSETAGGITASLDAKRDFEIGVRAGGTLGENTLGYVKVGYTNARFGASLDDGVTVLADSANADGIRFGLGFEHAYGKNLYAKAEYRYSNYEAGLERHQILVGVGYRF